MRVLVACEFSGTVRDAFAARGHTAYSCDLKASKRPGKHLQCNVLTVLRGIGGKPWDLLIIAHPPCTHLAVSGARWFPDKKPEQREALEFVLALMNAPVKRICIENPISIISDVIRKPDQIIQPWMFGDSYQKSTCLWLYGLPKLKPTNIVDKGEFVIHGGRKLPKWYSNRERDRCVTFKGIAEAMSDQWGQEVKVGLGIQVKRNFRRHHKYD